MTINEFLNTETGTFYKSELTPVYTDIIYNPDKSEAENEKSIISGNDANFANESEDDYDDIKKITYCLYYDDKSGHSHQKEFVKPENAIAYIHKLDKSNIR